MTAEKVNFYSATKVCSKLSVKPTPLQNFFFCVCSSKNFRTLLLVNL